MKLRTVLCVLMLSASLWAQTKPVKATALQPSLQGSPQQAGLEVNIAAGIVTVNGAPTNIVAQSIAVLPNATNYIFVTLSTGVLGSNTTGFTAAQYPIATVITNSSFVISLTDSRPDVFQGSSGSFTAAGDLSGNASSQEVVGLLSNALPSLTTGYLNWTGTAWALSAVSGGSAFPITVSGTVNSGGIPCFNSTTNEESSATIASGTMIKGGGSGNCIAASLLTDSGTTLTYSGTTGVVLSGTNASLSLTGTGTMDINDTEGTAPTPTTGSDLLWGDSTAHRWKMSNNNVAADTVVGAATTDTESNKTFVAPALGTPASGVITNLTGTCTNCGSNTVDSAASTTNSSFSILTGSATSGQQEPSTIASFTINPSTGAMNVPGALTVSSCSGCGGGGNTTSTSLTPNTVPKANGANSIINSLFTDNGTTGTYSGTGGITASGGPLTAGNPSGGVGSSVFLTQEGTVPSGLSTSAEDNCYADSTQHGLLCNFNAGTTLPLIQGPASATSGHIATFSGTNGGKVVDGGAVPTGTVTTFSAGALSPLFTTSVATASTTPALSFTLSSAASGTFLGNNTNASAAPAYVTLSAINPQTATYQVLAADFAAYKTITVASGSFTITLVASGSQPAAGQYINIINYGSGTVTIARSGQNINGATTSITLNPGTSTNSTGATIWSDGTNYFASVDEDNSNTGTVTVVGAGSLTNTAFVTGGGTTTIQTPSSTATLSSGGAPSFPGAGIFSAAGTASTPGLSVTGVPFVGTGTTSTPQLYLNQGTAPTTWNSTASGGTEFGINAASGFVGNFEDYHVNGGASVFQVTYQGNEIITQTAGTTTALNITNSTAATSSTAQSSPYDIRSGQFWYNPEFDTTSPPIAAATATDCWSHQVIETNGSNGASSYQLLHNGASPNCAGSPAIAELVAPFAASWGVQTNTLAQASAPTVALQGSGTGGSWVYAIVACIGASCANVSSTTSTTGPTTINTSNWMKVTWSAVTSADFYQVYRTSSGGTPASTGAICLIPAGATLECDDKGLTADGTTAQVYNATGQVYVGTGPKVGGGTGGGMFSTVGTVPSTIAGTAVGWYGNSTNSCFDIDNEGTDLGCAIGVATAQTMTGAKTFSGGIVNTTKVIDDQTIGFLAAAMGAQTTATCTNITNMTWNIAANKNYVLRCEIPMTLATTATIQYCLGGPGTATSYSLIAEGDLGTAGIWSQISTLAQTAYGTKTGASAAVAATTVQHVWAGIQNGSTASGTALTLQTAANGTNAITVGANATCTLTQTN
jgi:hypothetical protein